MDKLNEVITEAGGKPLDYKDYIKTCFDKAYATQIIRQGDVSKVKGTKKRKTAAKPEDKVEEPKKEEAKKQEEEKK